MSAEDEEKKSSEIIIIRRGHGSGEEGHHGGVWKIAYADFMTAMMAFFLVMWLINSTDKKTLTQVATYFNPLRLTDKVPSTKGVHQIEGGVQINESQQQPSAPSKDEKHGKDEKKEHAPEAAKPKSDKHEKVGDQKADGAGPQFTEEALFEDPMGVLAKLASQAAKEQEQAKAVGRSSGGKLASGQAYRDPFDPAFRREAQARTAEREKAAADARAKDANGGESKAGELPKSGESKAGDLPKSGEAASGRNERVTALPPGESTTVQSMGGMERNQADKPEKPVTSKASADKGQAEKAPADKATASDKPPAPDKAPLEKAQADKPTLDKTAADKIAADRAQAEKPKAEKAQAEIAEAAKLESELKTLITQYLPGAAPHVEVTVTDEGLLISLTDDYDFGMFAIASAEPRPAMVVVMEKLARVLAGKPERLVVRGHTDGRPYSSGRYDNWRLSTARAQMAYYMLLRGGIEEKRFERIEGHADRSLRVANDPEAAPNRRIEILLRKSKP